MIRTLIKFWEHIPGTCNFFSIIFSTMRALSFYVIIRAKVCSNPKRLALYTLKNIKNHCYQITYLSKSCNWATSRLVTNTTYFDDIILVPIFIFFFGGEGVNNYSCICLQSLDNSFFAMFETNFIIQFFFSFLIHLKNVQLLNGMLTLIVKN